MRRRIVLGPAACVIALLLLAGGCGGRETASGPGPPPNGSGAKAGPWSHGIYSASSDDGMDWTFDDRLLIDHASVPAAIVTPEGKLRVYYVDASHIDASEQQPENVNCAESSDGGKTFEVLGCWIEGRSGDKAVDPSVVLLPDGRYRLYYYAVSGMINTTAPHSICSAVSADGVHFTQEKEVFSYPGLVDPDVFWNGREWLMFVFSIADGKLVLAKSTDGLSFAYSEPLSLEGYIIVTPVRLDDGRFRAYGFDQATQQQIASFVSEDGMSWTREPGVRLTAPEGKGITDPFVVRMPDGKWKMILKVQPEMERPPPPPPPGQ